MASRVAPPDYPLSNIGLEAEALLQRYPALSRKELDRLVEIFPRLPALDSHLIRGAGDLSLKMDAFSRDHGARLKRPSTIMFTLAFLGLPLVLMIGLLWWALGPAL